ncbi:MAG TPA: SpoIIE family protein phosphatase [Devosiaceae bacterium]|jgi:sigma-B regulation protein RsbU (phosphoserine phosphatase)|nr:SpoIIE family protein phosphatase [Devosiaceae bacterium]
MTNVSTADIAGAMPSEAEVETLRLQLAQLQDDHEDLKLLYEALMEHGEAVEDQLAEKNLLLERTQLRLEAELQDAARYVMSILPDKRPKGPATDWLLVSSTELGGDSFGYHDIDDDHLAIYLIDVCGHGVGAALLSVTVMNVLRSASLSGADFHEPSAVLGALNDAFPMERQDNMFFTCWYGAYQRSTGALRYASGGHPPAIHIRKKRGRQKARWAPLSTQGSMVIGALPQMSYPASVAQIAPGDCLLVLSDGTFEVDDAGGTQLGIEKLADYCAAHPQDLSKIFEWVRKTSGGPQLPDDFSLLKISF